MPISRDMAIFVLTTTTQPITLPLAHACGVITTQPITLPLAHACGVIRDTYYCKNFHIIICMYGIWNPLNSGHSTILYDEYFGPR